MHKKYSSFSDKVPNFDCCNIHPSALPETSIPQRNSPFTKLVSK